MTTTPRKCLCPTCPGRPGCPQWETEDLDTEPGTYDFDPDNPDHAWLEQLGAEAAAVSPAWDPRKPTLLGPGLTVVKGR